MLWHLKIMLMCDFLTLKSKDVSISSIVHWSCSMFQVMHIVPDKMESTQVKNLLNVTCSIRVWMEWAVLQDVLKDYIILKQRASVCGPEIQEDRDVESFLKRKNERKKDGKSLLHQPLTPCQTKSQFPNLLPMVSHVQVKTWTRFKFISL